MDDDGYAVTPRVAMFQHFDAFGNRLTKMLTAFGMYTWRGDEGSVYDRDSGLVHMQARHYDPSTGRFIQADSLPLSGFGTQPLNRYIYCQNDPVNKSDPTGYVLTGWGIFAGVMMVLTVIAAFSFGGPLVGLAALTGAVMGMYAAIFYQMGMARCNITASQLDWDMIFQSGAIGAGVGVVGLTPAGGYAGASLATHLVRLQLMGGAAGGVGFLYGLFSSFFD